MFLLMHFDLFYFFVLFLAKKNCSENSFLAYIFLQFLMHFFIPSGTNLVNNIKYGESEGEKKSKTTSVALQECQQEVMSQEMIEISKNLKNYIVCFSFSALDAVKSSQN